MTKANLLREGLGATSQGYSLRNTAHSNRYRLFYPLFGILALSLTPDLGQSHIQEFLPPGG
jgi:hypothetical protein